MEADLKIKPELSKLSGSSIMLGSVIFTKLKLRKTMEALL